MPTSGNGAGKGSRLGPATRLALRLAVYFVVIGAAWILLSDLALQVLVRDPDRLTRLQTWKGWSFVLGTGTLLFVITRRELRGRMAAETALERQARLQQLMVDQVRDHAIFALDMEGRVSSWNEGARATLQREGRDVLGQPVARFFVPDEGARRPEQLMAASAEAGGAELEAWCLRGDGARIWMHTIITPLRDEQGSALGFACIMQDLSERKQYDRARAELLIREHAVRVQAEDNAAWAMFLAEAGDLLAGTLENLDDVAHTVLRLACDSIADWCAIYLPAREGHEARADVRHRDAQRRGAAEELRARVLETGVQPFFVDATRAREVVLMHTLTLDRLRDLVTDTRQFELLRRLATRSMIIVPLMAHGAVIGTLVLVNGDSGRIYGELDASRAQELAGRAALAIVNARLFREARQARADAETKGGELRRQLERLAAQRTIDMAITGSMDLRLTLGVILDQVTALVRTDAAAVLLLDRKHHVLRYAAGRGFRTEEITQTELRLSDDSTGRAVVERQTMRTTDLSDATRFRRQPLVSGEGFVDHIIVPLVSKGDCKGVLEVFHRSPLGSGQDWLSFLEALADQAAIAIDSALMFEELQRTNTELALSYDRTLEGWSRALEFRDREAPGHTERVTSWTLRLAQALGLPDRELVHLRRGALLHDIGKMAIPDSILLKPGPLSDEEWVHMRRHPLYAYQLLSPIPFLRQALDIPLFHHEAWDGTGYPYGLAKESIPLAARVFAVVDVWDALRSVRPYRDAWPELKVQAHLRAQAGTSLDPSAVDTFLLLRSADFTA